MALKRWAKDKRTAFYLIKIKINRQNNNTNKNKLIHNNNNKNNLIILFFHF